MKVLVFSFLLIFILSTNAVFAPLPVHMKHNEDADWSALFPEIEGCVREIKPLTQNGVIFEQTAVYKPQSPEKTNPPTYYGCGSITLRLDPFVRKAANAAFAAQPRSPFFRKEKVKTFDAYGVYPFCGNDLSRGTISVYFDEDKVLIVSARRGAGNLLKFVETADYEPMKKTIDEFIKGKI